MTFMKHRSRNRNITHARQADALYEPMYKNFAPTIKKINIVTFKFTVQDLSNLHIFDRLKDTLSK